MLHSAGNRRIGWHAWVALGAAYLLLVQALLTGLSIGVAAAQMSTQAPGFVICSSNGAHAVPHGSGQQPDSSHLPNCCVLGCIMLGPGVAPPPAATWLPVLWMQGRPILISFDNDRVDLRPERTPRNPRAPPQPT
jgi:hypothetical protein